MTLEEKFEAVNVLGISCLFTIFPVDSWSKQMGISVSLPVELRNRKWLYAGLERDLNYWSVEQLAGHVSTLLYGGKPLTQFTSNDKLQRQAKQLGAALKAVILDPSNEQAAQALGLAFARLQGFTDVDQAMEFTQAFTESFRGETPKQIGSSSGY